MFSAKFNLLKQKTNKILNKTKLQTLDYMYNGEPFVNIVSKNQTTLNLDIQYKGQPFIGAK